jgi:hypothetical protein
MTETCSQIVTDGHPLLGAELAFTAAGELLDRELGGHGPRWYRRPM